MDSADSQGIFDSQGSDKYQIKTSVMIFTGKKLDQAIPLNKFLENSSRHDTISLKANCGVIQTFMLNQVPTVPGLLDGFEGDSSNESIKKTKSITGKSLLESIKGKKDQNKPSKNQDSEFVNCNVFIGVDKNTGSLVYFNLDAVLR